MKFSARKIISIFLVSCYLLLVTALPAFAESNYQTPNTNSDVPKNLHTYSQSVLLEVASAVICQLAGIDIVSQNQSCLGIDPQTGKIGYVKNGTGLIGIMTSSIAMLYTPPAHISDYTGYLASNFGIAKKAYAQNKGGYGFSGLKPIFSVWNAFKNIVYLVFVIVFVLVGFAIMLRIKIDPRTVMTIENQIPKLIIGIILATFSFAIAGLLIDLMWVFTYLSVNVLVSAHPGSMSASTITRDIQTPPIGFVDKIFNGKTTLELPGGSKVNIPAFGGVIGIARESGLAVQHLVSGLFAPKDLGQIFKFPVDVSDSCGFFDLGCWAGKVIGGTIGTVMSQIIGWILSWVIGVLAILIIIVALIVALFRVWFQLITAYVYIILDTVLAPFFILGGLLPGSPIGFGAWLRDMLANLLAFPVTIILFLMGKIFMDVFANPSLNKGDIFNPPLIGNPSVTNGLAPLIGLGFILLTPTVVTMLKEFLHAPQFKYTAAIFQSLGTGPGVVQSGFHAATSPYGALAAFHRLKNKGAYQGILGAITGVYKHKAEAPNKPPADPTVAATQATQSQGSHS